MEIFDPGESVAVDICIGNPSKAFSGMQIALFEIERREIFIYMFVHSLEIYDFQKDKTVSPALIA